MNPSCQGNYCLAAWRWVLLASLAIAPGRITAVAQGTVNFANLVVVNGQRVVDAPVRDGSGQLAGSGFKAQLYAGPAWSPVENLVPVGSPESFQTGTGAGYFLGGTRAISSVPPGLVARVQVRVWSVASGATWENASLRLC